MIHQERVKPLNPRAAVRGDYVLYWMQASQRAEWNHALEFAIMKANELGKPLVTYFGLTDDFPEANSRHYEFMLEGLKEVASALRQRGTKMVVRHEPPARGVVQLAKHACLVVVDRGYLRVQKEWRRHAAEQLRCAMIQVETDAVVPVETASLKEEFSAATFRPRIGRKLPLFLVPLDEGQPRLDSTGLGMDSLDVDDIETVMSGLAMDRSVGRAGNVRGGTSEARRRLEAFLSDKLDEYPERRNDPNEDGLSNLSPYLHFGQISPLSVALQVLQTRSRGSDAYLEQLIIRRELSLNYVHYNPNYDSFEGLPAWAQSTLRTHERDARQYRYTPEELEEAGTHDPYWNAAQNEMRTTGKMHGYMRMYWGKKIIEWTESPQEAFKTALHLNNKYELDGRDPNGFTGVAWCFGKHDRPWRERAILGKVRYMNDRGLRRKFDADEYARRWSSAKSGGD